MKKIRLNIEGVIVDTIELYSRDVTSEHSCSDYEFESIVYAQNRLVLVNRSVYTNNPSLDRAVILEKYSDYCEIPELDRILNN